MAKIVQYFYELDVYQKAFEVSLDLHKASLAFPKIEQYAMADQIRRASKSISANIAEGFHKQKSSKKEFNRYLAIAMASANEMLVWIQYCKELKYIDEDIARHWYTEYLSIAKMLNALSSKSPNH